MQGRKTPPAASGHATSAPPHTARVSKRLLPGQNGTKRYGKQFGDALVCVRYRHDTHTGMRYTTVEIVVDVHKPRQQTVTTLLDHNEIIAAHVD